MNTRLSKVSPVHIAVGATAVAALAAGAVYVANYFMTPRAEFAKEWSENADNLCYTANQATETEFHTNNIGAGHTANAFSKVKATGPIGSDIVANHIGDDTIFCFGHRHESAGQDGAYKQPFRGLYFFDAELKNMDVEVASYLFKNGLGPYIDDATDNRVSYFTMESGLIWNRSIEAMKAVIIVDATYAIIEKAGAHDVFAHDKWQSLRQKAQTKAAAEAYETASSRLEGRYNAFFAAYSDPDVQDDADLDFINWQKNQLYDEYTEKLQQDSSGNWRTSRLSSSELANYRNKGWIISVSEVSETVTYGEPPSSYVHSEELHPETLIALSSIFFDDGPFLSEENANMLLNDQRAIAINNTRVRQIANEADGIRHEFGAIRHGCGFGAIVGSCDRSSEAGQGVSRQSWKRWQQSLEAPVNDGNF